jgi:vacuolar-type H+-ATPase subunit D/Vma8
LSTWVIGRMRERPAADGDRGVRDIMPTRSAFLGLREEYQRTATRARALEDVLLPEIDQALASVDTPLEELDKEEAIGVRCVRPES